MNKNGFEAMVKESRQIPWASAASFFSELRRDETIRVPTLTKEAALGAIKLSRIAKQAQNEAQFMGEVQRQSMTDPNVVAALDYEQAMAEIEALQNKIEEYEAENQIMAQQLQMSDQNSQQAQQQMEQMGQQLQQEQMQRQSMTEQAMQAQDAALKSRVDMSSYRQQVVDGADQLLLQLKQMIAQDPAMQQAQAMQQQQMQAQAAQAQQAQAEQAQAQQQPVDQNGQPMDQGQSMGEAAGQPTMDQGPMYEETRKQMQEADTSAQNASMQAGQAEQAAMQEQAKMGSARAHRVVELLKQGRTTRFGYSYGPEGEMHPSYQVEYKRRVPSLDPEEEAEYSNLMGEMAGTMGGSLLGGVAGAGLGSLAGRKWAPIGALTGMGVGTAAGLATKGFGLGPRAAEQGRARALAQRDRLVREAKALQQLEQENPGIGDSISRLQALEQYNQSKMGAAKTAMDPRMVALAQNLGIRAAGAGIGALAGGGAAVFQQAGHRRQYGDQAATTVSAPEIEIASQRAAAEVKSKADPTFLNKLRVMNLQRREDLARISRENPDGAIAFGALLGAGTGAAVAPSVYGLGQRLVQIGQGQGQLGRFARSGVDAARQAVPALAGMVR